MKYLYKENSGFRTNTFSGDNVPDECIEVTDDEFKKLKNHELCWSNGKLINYTKGADEINKQIKKELRRKREPLLKAFDIYKSNVAYGVINETEEQHLNVTNWYNKILDLNEEAINNPPQEIANYL